MKRALLFAGRELRELLRDPLSYIFCLGFPLVMLALMTTVNSMIPAGTMTLFEIDSLTAGIAVFGLSFVMLFAALSVSKDRAGAFLTRLFSSPMKAADFIVGYTLSLLTIAVGQLAATFVCGALIGLAGGTPLPLGGSLLCCAVLLPIALFFIGCGLLFGTLMNDRAAPPCSSIIISVASVLGGVWFDVFAIPEGNPLKLICNVLPFAHATAAARALIMETGEDILPHIGICVAWAVAVWLAAVLAFRARMRGDSK